MAFSTTENTATVGTTEYSFQGGTTSGVPLSNTTECCLEVLFDCNALAAGDLFLVQGYEKVASGGTQRVFFEASIAGPTPTKIVPLYLGHVKYGWDVTLKKITGTDRSIPGSVRKVTA